MGEPAGKYYFFIIQKHFHECTCITKTNLFYLSVWMITMYVYVYKIRSISLSLLFLQKSLTHVPFWLLMTVDILLESALKLLVRSLISCWKASSAEKLSMILFRNTLFSICFELTWTFLFNQYRWTLHWLKTMFNVTLFTNTLPLPLRNCPCINLIAVKILCTM